ncbi:MAG TPA: serpin family protein [Phycisphaerae bacterium]|nr:serpin family protein [Phycisphaerae bacterium]
MRCALGAMLGLLVLGGGAYAAKADAKVPATDQAKVAEAVNRFAFDLYAKLKDQEGNLFLSPYSISTALTMTYAGARGTTAEQMDDVLCLPGAPEEAPGGPPYLHAAFAALQNDLNAGGRNGHYELAVANLLWGQKDYAFLPEFLNLLEANYGARLETVDFAGATEAARQSINAWVERRTRDKIKELLKPGILDRLTRLVLTNAIYFKGQWLREFPKDATRDEDFFVTPDKKVTAPMMHQTEEFGYFEGPDFQALELSYKGEDLAMLVLLPKERDGLVGLEKALSAEKVADTVAKLRKQKVIVALPKFKTTAEFTLNEPLIALGMGDAFNPGKADFSGMNGRKDLFISAVVHKAFVDVSEEGTEAAAATGVVMALTALPEPPPVFRADHPFLHLIRDRQSGAILFLGRLTDPTR